eukprot:CAMPEP_0170561254 /NCGR_PEP_ID=MMETSP0211-20121228/53715_1 /TAXON_ID=311385 /ORGANISM="Pseudokeronopsis sp., Strain OXSARD2" /LENGTH=68 /DNA_ID=CAMNT_0010876567 /DNA_START=218 /DNA_END=424 /DNA_ORIENTATION=+
MKDKTIIYQKESIERLKKLKNLYNEQLTMESMNLKSQAEEQRKKERILKLEEEKLFLEKEQAKKSLEE